MEAERQKLRAKINDLGRMNEEKRKTVKSDHKASDFKLAIPYMLSAWIPREPSWHWLTPRVS